MKTLVVISGCFLLKPCFSGSDFKNEKAAVLKQAIENDPKSENKRMSYAVFLLGESRFEEANLQVKEILKLNPENADAKHLSVALPEIISQPDASKKKQQISSLHMYLMDSAMKNLQSMTKELGKLEEIRLPDDLQREMDEEKGLFDKKYNVSARIKNEYKPKVEEFEFSQLIHANMNEKNFPKVDALYSKWIKVHPLSPKAYAEYVKFLISQDRTVKATKVLEEANGKFPSQSIALDILSEHLPRIKEAKSSEQINAAKEALSSDWLDLTMYRMDSVK